MFFRRPEQNECAAMKMVQTPWGALITEYSVTIVEAARGALRIRMQRPVHVNRTWNNQNCCTAASLQRSRLKGMSICRLVGLDLFREMSHPLLDPRKNVH